MSNARKRKSALSLCLLIILQTVCPAVANALTGGPALPDFQSFEPIGTTEMVDLPGGGFTYNITLGDVGGYPINLSYHSGITADMEAGSAGLGMSINPGTINRSVRAIPDDFNGEEKVEKTFNMRPNITAGASLAGGSLELFGKETSALQGKLGLNMGVFVNNYAGIGYEFGLTPTFSSGIKGMKNLTAGMGMSLNSKDGANFAPSLSYSRKVYGKEKHVNSATKFGAKIGLSVHSREGLYSRSISGSIVDETNSETRDKTLASSSFNTSAKFSYASKTFTPNIAMPQNNFSATFNFKPAGVALFGSNTSTSFSGYVSTQRLRQPSVSKPAYGLLYAEKGRSDENALMDFNREKETMYHDYAINLPIVNAGYDVLSVAGQGIGGSYQLKRSDVPMFFDAKSTAVSNGGSLGLEVGGGNLTHWGIDLNYSRTTSTSGKWSKGGGNDLLDRYDFKRNTPDGYEPAYYKAAGEMAVETDAKFYKNIGEDRAVRAHLAEDASSKFKVESTKELMDVDGNLATSPSASVQRSKRERRNQVISYLTAEEATVAGLTSQIFSYRLNQFIGANAFPRQLARSLPSQGKQPHHISQVDALRPDGMRYVYSTPAYNLSQEEVSFNASGSSVKCATGNITYNGSDASKDNKRGKDHFYSSVKTPAYAHSYLLTAVLSNDYEDLTGNGLTVDDSGSWTHLKYAKITTDAQPAHWRVPFHTKEATYNPGLFSKSSDETGSFIYGTKEVWLVHSIDSKTMTAEFTYSDREDGYGVAGRDGGIASTNYSKKLDRITIYSKPDRLANGTEATPIKTIHFNYNYELCPNTPNSKAANGGKLTLKEVYFTYGHSKKGKLSPYKFNYKQDNNLGRRASYDRQSYDRWGNYKPNESNLNCDKIRPGQKIPNDEYPYSEQNRKTADKNAGMWSLEKIELPSGGMITVNYKSKHYASVQDRPAMAMTKITGIGRVGNDNLYQLGMPLTDQYLKVLFKLKKPITGPATDQKTTLRRDYLRGFNLEKDHIYLKNFVQLSGYGLVPADQKWEYISLYSKIKDYGVDPTGDGFIVLAPLPADDNGQAPNLNPITKYSFQFIREFLPDLAYGDGAVTPEEIINNPLRGLAPLASMGLQLVQFVTGYNRVMLARGAARKIDVQGRSYVRLTTPDEFKMGGGSMVSKVQIHDRWGDMIGDNSRNYNYGQIYDYTTTDAIGRSISSGVASYEPAIGGDENPFRRPVVIKEDRKWAIDNVHYIEEPFGESMMPAPNVVFSEIKVRNLPRVNVQRTGTGHATMKYYTSEDFPTILDHTEIQKEPRRRSPLLSLLKVKMKEHANNSFGVLIKNNNMHGQPRANEVYDENGTLISKVEYFYKTKANGTLDNEVDVMQRNGKLTKGLLGLDYQLAGDARESLSKTFSVGASLNLDGFLVGLIPAIVPIPWPNYESNERRYRAISMTKAVHQYGVLDSVVATDLGSKIATVNKAWDAETGEVLLTKTYNEFDDPIFNFKWSAHLNYAGMQGAYKNIGAKVKLSSVGNGVYSLADASLLTPGDELLVKPLNRRAWVLHTSTGGTTDQVFLIDRLGTPVILNGQHEGKVIRSGYRNMPMATIGSITSKENPFVNGELQVGQGSKILNAGAVEFSDRWQTYCFDQNLEGNCYEDGLINPFVRNVLGIWRPEKSWLYLAERNRNPLNGTQSSTNIRDNGIFDQFSPFWNYNRTSQSWYKKSTDWEWTTEVTKVNPNGTELESKDVLDRFAAEITGYYGQLVSGVAANSKYQQIAFEGFEDYRYEAELNKLSGCKMLRHFEIVPGNNTGIEITDQQYHTGKYSLAVPQNKKIRTAYTVGKSVPCNNNTPAGMMPFNLDQCDCVSEFSPDPGRYVVTAWVKEGAEITAGAYQYKDHKLSIETTGPAGTNTQDFVAKGHIIEGWQRIEGAFDISSTDQQVAIVFSAGSPNRNVFFDDFRCFPVDGNMKNFVYNDVSLKLMAELDVNGYAKLYEYDASGQLVRVKKETERGVMTIQESATGRPK